MRSALTTLGLLLLLAACSGSGGDGGETAMPSAAAVIGAAGGTVSTTRAGVEVPAGALPAPVSIAIGPADGSAPPLPTLPAGALLSGAPISLTPHGTVFLSPAVLHLPLPELRAGEQVAVLKSNRDNTGWEQLPAQVVGSSLRVSLRSFSTIRLITFCQAAECLVGPPTFAMQPASGGVDEGGFVLLSNSAVGLEPFTYQWRRDGVPLPGQTAQALLLRPVSLADDGMRLSVTVTDRLGRSSTSEAATVQVRALAPRVATQPADVQAVAGGPATFLAGTVSGLPQSLQWQRSNDGGSTWVAAGSVQARLALAAVTTADDGALFRLEARNGVGAVVTRAARLAVLPQAQPPAVLAPPASVATVPGRGADFSVQASGGGLAYRWERSDDGVSWRTVGTDPQLTISNTGPADDGARFRATVSNAAGSATSAEGRLSVAVAPGFMPVRLATGADFSLALSITGQVYTWGDNTQGQLGAGNTDARLVPGVVPGLSGVATLAAGWQHALVLLTDGRARGWGRNDGAQVDIGQPAVVVSPTPVAPGRLGRGLLAGEAISVLLQNQTGGAATWNWGSGMMIDGQTWGYRWVDIFRRTGGSVPPTAPYGVMPGGPPIVRGAIGPEHRLLVRSDGSVLAAGSNWAGRLGFGQEPGSAEPVVVPGLQRIVMVGAGEYHSVALDDAGRVFTMGLNDLGQLGVPGPRESWSPVEVPLPAPAIAVASGLNFCMALLADGQLMAWGNNGNGQAGSMLPPFVTSPRRVPLPVGVRLVAIAAGPAHALVLDDQGRVWGWGRNRRGQLGTGDLDDRFEPVQVPLPNLNQIF